MGNSKKAAGTAKQTACSAEEQILSLCRDKGINYKSLGDAIGLLSKKVQITLNPELSEKEAQVKVEEEVVKICKDNNLRYRITFNSNGSKVIPKIVEVTFSKSKAFDVQERNLIKHMMKSGKKYIGHIDNTIHHYDFGDNPPMLHSDFLTVSGLTESVTHMPALSDIRKQFKETKMEEIVVVEFKLKQTLLGKIARRIPLVKIPFLKRDDALKAEHEKKERERRREKEEARKKSELEDMLVLAGIPGHQGDKYLQLPTYSK